MKTIGTSFTAELAKKITTPNYLVRIFFPSLTVTLSSRGVVNWGDLVWAKRHIRVSGSDVSGDARASMNLEIGNEDLAMSTLILADGFAGVGVEVFSWWGTAFVYGTTEYAQIINGQGSSASIDNQNVNLQVSMQKTELLQFPGTPRIGPPLFNSVLPSGYEIAWGTERYRLKRG